jgi:hypothetical protein|tara:strand:+ start:408 stop:593 length:186 start_codon:yes stop_codon:yes gene_type:complete
MSDWTKDHNGNYYDRDEFHEVDVLITYDGCSGMKQKMSLAKFNRINDRNHRERGSHWIQRV